MVIAPWDESLSASGHVPLRSVWLLQVYASQLYQRGLIEDAAIEEAEVELPTLIGSMLCHVVEERLHKELSVDFRRHTATLQRVRGRIDHFETARNHLLEKGQVRCTFNKLTHDSEINRYLLRALVHCKANQNLLGDRQLASRCQRLIRELDRLGVVHSRNSRAPRRRLMREDVRPVAVAELVLELSIPSSGTAPHRAAFARREVEESYLRRIFEDALLGLYRFHLEPLGWQVRGGQMLGWPTPDAPETMPVMYTDISLTTPQGNSYIVDAKFTSMYAPGRVGKLKLRSEHLYQLYAYVMSQSGSTHSAPAGGAMIYATAGTDADAAALERKASFSMHGKDFVFAALDLTASPRRIRDSALTAARALAAANASARSAT